MGPKCYVSIKKSAENIKSLKAKESTTYIVFSIAIDTRAIF